LLQFVFHGNIRSAGRARSPDLDETHHRFEEEADSMITHVRCIGLACLSFAAVAIQPALAQPPVLIGQGGITIEYKEPTNPAHRVIYERLRKRQVLEQFKAFMSPLKLKRHLLVSLQGCDGFVNAMYQDHLQKITYCYEYVVFQERMIAEAQLLPGFRREDAIVGDFVSTLLHEVGHALFHLLDIPIFGREEDAADAVASYVALRVGPTTARRILTGTAFAWRAAEMQRQKQTKRQFDDYSDEHGTEAQRFFNTLCIAVGSDMVERTDTFKAFVQLLPAHRRGHCPREYLHVKKSFEHFFLPHVDLAAMKKVQAQEWLRSEDGSEIFPPGPPGGPSGGPGGGGPGDGGPGGGGPGGGGPGGGGPGPGGKPPGGGPPGSGPRP
jgi:hypothetical protein